MITVSGLTKKYGERTVVNDVSFTLEPGTVTGFLGPNGAGKTTTMRMMTSLVAPTAGSALVDGKLYAELPNPGAVVGTLLDASAVHPGRTGRTHLRLHRRRRSVSPASRVDEVLELVGLTDAGRRRIGGYSLGMRQRLGIAGALLADPPVLIFDEPANGLDPEGIRWMRDLLRGHAARGGTVLLSSHLLNEVEHTVDRLLVIGNGRIVADGLGRHAAGRRRDDGPRRRTRTRWPGPLGRRPSGRAGSGRRPGRRRRGPRRRCSPSPPPVATCSPSSGRPSAASRTSSSSSPPRHDRRRSHPHRATALKEPAMTDILTHAPPARPVHRTLRRLLGGPGDPQVPVHPLGQGGRPRRRRCRRPRPPRCLAFSGETLPDGRRPDRRHGPADRPVLISLGVLVDRGRVVATAPCRRRSC